MSLQISKGELTEDSSGVVGPGESSFSAKTWAKMILKAKNKDEKELLKDLKATDKRAKKSKKVKK